MLAVVVATMAVPAAAGATTLFGSGSSAEQPIMNVLFRAYNKLHKNIRFNYLPDGGNAGVQDVQAGRRLFSINTRPPLPSDAGTTYFKLWLDGLCIAVNPSNSVSDLTIAQTKNIFTGVATNWSQELRLEPYVDDRSDRPQLHRRLVHVLPAGGAGGRDAIVERAAGDLRRVGRDRGLEGPIMRSATSASPTRARAAA